MGVISLEKSECLFWLGRYTERVYTTIRIFNDVLDKMLDQETKRYEGFCQRLNIPNIYTSPEDFVDRYLFDPDNPDSIYTNLSRAYDNALVLRNEISSMTLSYIQMALDIMATSRGTDNQYLMNQRILDYLLAFWGSLDDNVEGATRRNLVKCGKYTERLDLYCRLDIAYPQVEKEFKKLSSRMSKLDIPYRQKNYDRLAAYVQDDLHWPEHRKDALACVDHLFLSPGAAE